MRGEKCRSVFFGFIRVLPEHLQWNEDCCPYQEIFEEIELK